MSITRKEFYIGAVLITTALTVFVSPAAGATFAFCAFIVRTS